MYCRNCGKELVEGLEECPFCHYEVNENTSSKKAKNKKWIPYFKRENSIYKKHPFLAWSITIIGILGGIWLMNNSYQELQNKASFDAGYRDAIESIRDL